MKNLFIFASILLCLLSSVVSQTAFDFGNTQLVEKDSANYEAVTLSSPSVFAGYSDSYACFREQDDSLWMTKLTNPTVSWRLQRTLSSARQLGGSAAWYSLYKPALASLGIYNYLAVVDKSLNKILLARSSSPDLPPWAIVGIVPIPLNATSGPSLSIFTNNRIYLSYRATNNNIYVGSYDPTTQTWSSFTTVQNSFNVSFRTLDAPNLVAVTSGSLNYRLWITFRSLNTLYWGYASLDAYGAILGWTVSTISSPYLAVEAPALAKYGNSIYIAFQNSQHKLCFGRSTDEVTFGNWRTYDDHLAIGAPAMIQTGSLLRFAFQAFAQDNSKKFLLTSYLIEN